MHPILWEREGRARTLATFPGLCVPAPHCREEGVARYLPQMGPCCPPPWILPPWIPQTLARATTLGAQTSASLSSPPPPAPPEAGFLAKVNVYASAVGHNAGKAVATGYGFVEKSAPCPGCVSVWPPDLPWGTGKIRVSQQNS